MFSAWPEDWQQGGRLSLSGPHRRLTASFQRLLEHEKLHYSRRVVGIRSLLDARFLWRTTWVRRPCAEGAELLKGGWRNMSAGAAAIARRLGGARAGAGFLCHCPVPTHGKGRGDLRPSLAVSDGEGGLMCHCFAGCAAADVCAAIEKLDLSVSPPARDKPELRRSSRRTNTADARALWRSARPTAGTSAEAYLRTRGFGLVAAREHSLPAELSLFGGRFSPLSCRRRSGALA